MLFLNRVMVPPPWGLETRVGGGLESCGDGYKVGGED